MVSITIRCNKRERDKYLIPSPDGDQIEWKVGELKFAVDDSELNGSPKAYLVECYFCGDIFGVVLSNKKNNGFKLDNITFPVTEIKNNFKSPIWSTTHTHTIWDSEKKSNIGKVARWDNTEVHGYDGKKSMQKLMKLIDNPSIKDRIRQGWKNNYLINKENKKLALWFIKMNHGCSMLDVFEFLKLNNITNDLTWAEVLVKGLISEELVKSNKNKLFMSYLSSPDAIELEVTERGAAVEAHA
jgi:hypothetical protein